MRISDWSSDVCSSDLDLLNHQAKRIRTTRVLQWPGLPTSCVGLQSANAPLPEMRPGVKDHLTPVHGAGALTAVRHQASVPRKERKSVVKEKSVSVRVDIGGRRIHTQKQKQKNE